MNFRLVTILGIIAVAPIGLAYVLFPTQTAAIFSITLGSTVDTIYARLFGTGLLVTTAAGLSVFDSTDIKLQRRYSLLIAIVSIVTAFVLVHALMAGVGNWLSWASAAAYALFGALYGAIAVRRES